jgi:hypothetical protein
MMMGLAPTPPARQAQSPRWHPLGSPPQGKIHHTGQDFTSFLGWGSIQTTLYAEIQGRDRPEPYEYYIHVVRAFFSPVRAILPCFS